MQQIGFDVGKGNGFGAGGIDRLAGCAFGAGNPEFRDRFPGAAFGAFTVPLGKVGPAGIADKGRLSFFFHALLRGIGDQTGTRGKACFRTQTAPLGTGPLLLFNFA